MSLFEKNILFYSDYCIHSTNFINNLLQQEELFESFVKINIDVDQTTRKRPAIFYTVQEQLNFKISEVPTVIVDNANYILSGLEAFKWLEYHLKKIEEEKKDLVAFNPNEMGAFSDSYSPLGSDGNNNASDQTFQFVGRPDQKIETPQQENTGSISQEDYNRKQKEREAFDNVSQNPLRPNLNAKMMQQQGGMQGMQQQGSMQQQHQQGVPPNMHRMDTVQNNKYKQNEMDSKLQQLILERQTSVEQPPRYNQTLDFKRGMNR
jgi:hypothetical protein